MRYQTLNHFQNSTLRRAPIFFTLLLAIALSCEKPLLQGEGRRDEPDSSHGDHVETLPSPEEAGLWASGVAYPDGYPWKTNPNPSTTPSWIVLYKGENEILRIPSGPDSIWSSDPDCHRIWNGHLYSFTVSGEETLIGIDGREVLRYEGAESLRGFAVDNGRIHTLGQRLYKGGLAYRIDGKAVFYADIGTIQGSLDKGTPRSGALFCDDGHWYFNYVSSGKLHMVKDNAEIAVPDLPVPADAVVSGGKFVAVRVKERYGRYLTEIIQGDKTYPSPPYLPRKPRSFALSGSGLNIRALAGEGGSWYIWDAGSTRQLETLSATTCEIYPRFGADAVVLSRGGKVISASPLRLPEEGEYVMSSGACAAWGPYFAAGLSSIDGGPNIIIYEEGSYTLPFNGPVTSIYFD